MSSDYSVLRHQESRNLRRKQVRRLGLRGGADEGSPGPWQGVCGHNTLQPQYGLRRIQDESNASAMLIQACVNAGVPTPVPRASMQVAGGLKTKNSLWLQKGATTAAVSGAVAGKANKNRCWPAYSRPGRARKDMTHSQFNQWLREAGGSLPGRPSSTPDMVML